MEKLNNFLHRVLYKLRANQCKRIYFKILYMGMDNDPSVQRWLDSAKDSIYTAKIGFEKLSAGSINRDNNCPGM